MSTEILDLAPGAVLARAADIIARNGLLHDDYFDRVQEYDEPLTNCRMCALGAIAAACGLPPDVWAEEFGSGADWEAARESARQLVDHLGADPAEYGDPLIGPIAGWNDNSGPDQVVTVLRAAAKAGA